MGGLRILSYPRAVSSRVRHSLTPVHEYLHAAYSPAGYGHRSGSLGASPSPRHSIVRGHVRLRGRYIGARHERHPGSGRERRVSATYARPFGSPPLPGDIHADARSKESARFPRSPGLRDRVPGGDRGGLRRISRRCQSPAGALSSRARGYAPSRKRLRLRSGNSGTESACGAQRTGEATPRGALPRKRRTARDHGATSAGRTRNEGRDIALGRIERAGSRVSGAARSLRSGLGLEIRTSAQSNSRRIQRGGQVVSSFFIADFARGKCLTK
jgi:hypothetical protein